MRSTRRPFLQRKFEWVVEDEEWGRGENESSCGCGEQCAWKLEAAVQEEEKASSYSFSTNFC